MLSVIRRARKSLGQFCLALGAVVLSACVPTAGPGTAPPGNGGTVQVALLVPSGSGQSQDELFGTNLENAARLAMADLSGVNIDLRVYRTGGSPAQAAAKKTTDDTEALRRFGPGQAKSLIHFGDGDLAHDAWIGSVPGSNQFALTVMAIRLSGKCRISSILHGNCTIACHG